MDSEEAEQTDWMLRDYWHDGIYRCPSFENASGMEVDEILVVKNNRIIERQTMQRCVGKPVLYYGTSTVHGNESMRRFNDLDDNAIQLFQQPSLDFVPIIYNDE